MALDNKIFRKPAKEFEYKLTINSEGLERSGKTNFALTAPGPIGIIALDKNTENIAIKAQKAGKEIMLADFCDPDPKRNPLAEFVLPVRAEPGKAVKTEQKASKGFYEKRWDAISGAIFDLINEKSIRSIVIDSGTQLWEDIRLARFGKLAQVAPREYGIVNQEMRELIMAVKCNLIVTHKLGKQYKGNDWDGRSYEGKGWSDIAYACQITLRQNCSMIRDEDSETPNAKRPQFSANIMDCNQDANLRGMELADEDCSFQTLASLVYPDAPSELWA